MKLLTLALAGIVAATGFTAVPAAAQERVVVRERTVVRHSSYRPRAHRVCTVRYRHHQRVRTCRTVYRRY